MTNSLPQKISPFNLKPNSSAEKWYVFDIETNGLYDDVNEIFCIVIYDVTRQQTITYGPDSIDGAIDALNNADVLIGHNIIFYDIPVLQKLKPSFVLKIDFGDDIGIKKSSAQLTKNYNIDQLIDKQIAAVINFPPKQIGKMVSEILVLGFPDDNNEPILVLPSKRVANGGKLF